jgi:rhodanese-related sulfurtransferase
LQGQNGNLTLVNTLAADEFEKTKIPGATNIPLASSDFAARVEQEAGGKDKPVVVYCASQQCNSSEKAAEKLAAASTARRRAFIGGAAMGHGSRLTADCPNPWTAFRMHWQWAKVFCLPDSETGGFT